MKYCLLLCPNDIKYITFITMPTNIIMYNIAKKYNFQLYEKSSGNNKHSSLFIKLNNDIQFKSSFV
jgi:hypothetical protein